MNGAHGPYSSELLDSCIDKFVFDSPCKNSETDAIIISEGLMGKRI